MHQKLQRFLSDGNDDGKELTRKLYWAVSSTIPLTRELKASTFSWAADLAEKILKRAEIAPPPAIRSNGRQVALDRQKRYTGLAGGGAAGRLDTGGESRLPSRRPLAAAAPTSRGRGVTEAELEKFKDDQARMKAAAIQYMADNVKVSLN